MSGVDLYARDAAGKWKWVQVTKPAAQTVSAQIISNIAPGEREYAAYLPLYNGVESLEIGVPKGAKFSKSFNGSYGGFFCTLGMIAIVATLASSRV